MPLPVLPVLDKHLLSTELSRMGIQKPLFDIRKYYPIEFYMGCGIRSLLHAYNRRAVRTRSTKDVNMPNK